MHGWPVGMLLSEMQGFRQIPLDELCRVEVRVERFGGAGPHEAQGQMPPQRIFQICSVVP